MSDIRFGSVCSGIEAARQCAKCTAQKPIAEFHKHRTGPGGRHSWCGACSNAAQKASRLKNGRPEQKAKWNLKTRYDLTPEEVKAMMMAQYGLCAICRNPMSRPVIDHNHETRQVRGFLCHGCNIKLPAIEHKSFRDAAIAYLARFA